MLACLLLAVTGCGVPALLDRTANTTVPDSYYTSTDTTNTAQLKWQEFFTDPYLVALIDSALNNNQELNVLLQEIEISRNEVNAKQGEYLPYVNFKAGAGAEKVGKHTRNGAVEESLEIAEGKSFPEPLGDLMFGAFANWEVDIWRKLRTSKKSAMMKYLASVEGRNFMVTHLVAEISNSYYELLALDTQLGIVNQNIQIQGNALQVVKLQKQAAKVTELAVKKFEAEVFKTRSLQYDIQQRIVETENRINFLVGRFPQPVPRSQQAFEDMIPATVQAGIPSQLLQNRPDIRQAERELAAAKLDIQVARANFYPSLGISAGVGFQGFNPKYLLTFPESLLFDLTGDLMAPLVNKKAIKAEYANANAKQVQVIYQYEQRILNAFIEVANQVSNISNLQQSYQLRQQQVQALTESITISNTLFRSARADYMEVLLTQRDALEARFELVETKMQQMSAVVNVYQALGGGWR